MSESPTCALCGESLGERALEAQGASYCSVGCQRVGETLGTSSDDSADSEESDPKEDGTPQTEELFFHIDGMHCGTCETFLEAVAEKQAGVSDAAASYVTETVRIEYNSAAIEADELADALSVVGYKATPREELSTVADQKQRRQDDRQLDDLLGFRYATGVLFGLFMLFPYIVVFYPAHAAEFLGYESLALFAGGPGPGDAFFIFPLFLIITSIVLFFTGMPLLRGAYVSLVLRQPNTDLLVSLTIVSAYVYGTIAFLSGDLNFYYDLTIVIAAVVVAAIFYESLTKQRAVDRLTDLTVSQVEQARRLDDTGKATETTLSELTGGDRLLVRQGERVPVDGTLEEGTCTVDEAVITGESLPVQKEQGDRLVGGSIVTDGTATICVGDPPTSSLEGITSAVWGLQSSTHGIQRASDRLASRVVPALLGIAMVAGVGGFVFGDGLMAACFGFLGVLMVLTPWGVGLSTPLSVARSIESAVARGIVIFDETVFERLRETDIIVFDKTGTLTTGEMELTVADAPADLLAAAAELEQHATHPAGEALATAIDFDARADGGTQEEPSGQQHSQPESAPRVQEVSSHDTGIEGRVSGDKILVGNRDLFIEKGWSVPADIETRAAKHREGGDLPVVLGRDGSAEGVVILGDHPRAEWEETLARLGQRDVKTVILTGDDEAPATEFGDHASVDYVFAGVPPAGKTATIRRLQQRGHVTMVGDGTNDGPALAVADLGISLGGGTALASEAADITVLDDDLSTVETAFELATAARRRLRQNSALALVYNFLTVPLALAGFLNPLFVMAATVLTAGFVGMNAARPLL